MKIKNLIIGFLFFCLISCGIGPRNLNGFTNYKYPIKDNNLNLLKYEGVYIILGKVHKYSTIRKVLKFSKEGHCFRTVVNKQFWENKNFWKDSNIYFHSSESKEYNYYFECEYKATNDTITLQYFVSNPQSFYSKYVIEEKYKIVSDSLLCRIERTAYKGNLLDKNKEVYKVKDTFKFFNMPDISFKTKKKWYSNKKWYKENLHKSRKN